LATPIDDVLKSVKDLKVRQNAQKPAILRQNSIKCSSAAEMGDRARKQSGPKSVGLLCFFLWGRWVPI